ncbi:MAG: hypothetical protein HEQ20_07800 [Aphanizomenon flos-aquae KM1D3_PB]|uniref:hypothetical protein n=1 Tax=Aphanizomenon flos-aquae TaxID=1176 RepID=UPI000A881FB4|nr:hypothetical protein [Aphanizomenon flos-aquae]QSV70677.1 MAG: hypothetical protein HEQ20_07800 [Aphanizomenon flos-aquae KM1D3_PB]
MSDSETQHYQGFGWIMADASGTLPQGYATLRGRSDCSAFTQCPAGIRLRSTTQPK